MPLTIIDIEKRKSWKISLLFIFLLFMYFALVFCLFVIPSFFFGFNLISAGNGFLNMFIVAFFSLGMAGLHFYLSSSNAAQYISENLSAKPPDPEDGIHRQLLNITDELNILTGNSHKIKAMVIPSFSLNALAVTDLKGNSMIAITEGFLSRLSRPQIEAVMAHEAYHIISGDCLENTVATSLFGMHATALEHLRAFSQDRLWGIHPAFMLYWALLKLSGMLSLFLSREREYRADAAALRMTRNPVAMAEALLLLSKNWTGTGFISAGLEMLCIISPDNKERDEAEGWIADLLLTHPPISRRIDVLLKMGRITLSDLEKKAFHQNKAEADTGSEEERYYALDQKNLWQGPYTGEDLQHLTWFSPVTWIASLSGQKVQKASHNSLFDQNYWNRHMVFADKESEFTCPQCRTFLSKIPYEKTSVYRCRSCRGTLVEKDRIPRIIARKEIVCSERIKALAQAVAEDNQRLITINKSRGAKSAFKSVLTCSECSNPMFRTFYSGAYLIEIDTCNMCGIVWFERDELEMLQCLVDNKITGRRSL